MVARVCRLEEVADLDLERQPLAATAVFSLKEAIYKAVFSATGIELDQAIASIAWAPNGPGRHVRRRRAQALEIAGH